MPMTSSPASGRFQWRDKFELMWTGDLDETPSVLTWRIRPRDWGGRYVACVQTHSYNTGEQLPMALLTDVEINRYMENRGAGSLLVQRAIVECKRRGHKGIEGKLSSVDIDHFDKLKHFYEILGFSVVFYDPEHPDYAPRRVGKVEMLFSQP